ncbi:hypothetical protein MKW98_022802, partial [Papaver atlanticum]
SRGCAILGIDAKPTLQRLFLDRGWKEHYCVAYAVNDAMDLFGCFGFTEKTEAGAVSAD